LQLDQPQIIILNSLQALGLEQFQKYYSPVAKWKKEAVFLGFGFVSAQSQAAAGLLFRQSLAKNPKASAPHGHILFENALICQSPFASR
jgi:hypothetical protein